MSFFSQLVSSLHDGSKSFIETTRRDIAEFSSAIQQETRELLPIAAAHLPLHHQRQLEDALGADHTSDGSGGGERAGAPEAGDTGSASAASSSSSSSGFPPPADGRLHFNLERLSGRVLNLLPSVFGSEDSSAGTEASSGFSSSQAAAERLASPSPSSPPSAFPQSPASYEQRLQRLMHDRRTFESDPVDAGSGHTALSFSPTLPLSSSAIAECLLDPVVRGLYAELVESSQSVSASAFWWRCFYARQRLEEEERKRQKLQLRLAGIRQQLQQQQRAPGGDELLWEEEDEEEQREAKQDTPPAAQQPAEAADQHEDEEREAEVRPVAAAAEDASDADAEDAAVAATRGAACGLSQSPVGSESSGELIDQAEGAEEWTQQSDAADGSRRSPATTAANSAAPAQPQQPQQQSMQDNDETADYAEWE